jgi:hypothetical protein|tara:strand:+ start:498 stop:1190 length:693 start_codon:yes stop_codon:yes gene_type:complete
MIVSIHQPNYLPWLGYFNKISRSDIFVIFDDVQFPKGKTGFFGNRNKIKTNTGDMWLTVPVLDRSQYKKFNEIKINYDGWNHKHLVNIKNFYKKTPFFNLYYDDLENIILKEYDTISDLSTSLIKYFLIQLDIDTEVVLSSTICKDSNLQGIDKIFYILESFPTDKYLTSDGPGSMRYIKEEDFKEKNIELVWQKFHHPTYTQRFGEFKSHLSIIDLLFNYGDESRGYIK